MRIVAAHCILNNVCRSFINLMWFKKVTLLVSDVCLVCSEQRSVELVFWWYKIREQRTCQIWWVASLMMNSLQWNKYIKGLGRSMRIVLYLLKTVDLDSTPIRNKMILETVFVLTVVTFGGGKHVMNYSLWHVPQWRFLKC